jgi:hypothetical protein
MIVSRPFQAIRIARAVLLVVISLAVGAACAGDDIAWSDPLTLSASAADSRLMVDGTGDARLVANTAIKVSPTIDPSACPLSIRAVRLDDGSTAAVWWSVRPDSSSVLAGALSRDAGTAWQPKVSIDTADVSTTGCNRPAPSIATSAGFVHVTYSMRASEGVGIFYAHSMNAGRSYEPAATIVYGDRLTRTVIAADQGTVAVAYEDPSGLTPQIGLAISRDWGHIFHDRVRGSTGVGAATDPEVAVNGREVAVSWAAGLGVGESREGPVDSESRTRIVRVGRLQ